MGYDLQLPNWKPLDSSGLGALGDAMVNIRKVNSGIEKDSADIARQKWEMKRKDEEDEHQRAVAAAQQLLPGSDVMRAKAISPELGSQVGSPYGISFEQKDEGPNLPPVDAEPHPDAASAQFLLGGAQPKAPGTEDPLLSAPTSPNNPLAGEVQPMQGPGPTGAPVDPQLGEQEQQPALNVDDATSARMPPTTRHMYAKVGASRFEVPADQPSALFEEPKYNAMVHGLVAQGIPEDKAIAHVAGVRRTDIGEGGKMNRFTSSLGQKEATQLTREERMGMQDKALDVSTANSRGRDAAILGSASIRAGAETGGGLQADPKMLAALNSRLTQIRGVTAWNKLAEADAQADMLAHDVETGAVPLQGREAQVLAARIIRGRVTDSEMRQLYTNLGGAQDSLNRLIDNQGLGQMTPEQKSQLVASTDVILNTHRMLVQRAKNVAKAGLDSRTFPAMPGQAQAGYDMMLAELGLPSEPIAPDNGLSPAAAAPVAPARHGGARHGAPSPAPAPAAGPSPQGGGMVQVKNKKTGETKMVPHDEAVRMGAIK